MTERRFESTLTPFTGALAVLLALWLPVSYTSYTGVEEVLSLFSLWLGLLYTAAMYSRRTAGHQISLFPLLQAFMAVTGYTLLQEGAFVLAAFLGSLAYGARTGMAAGRNLLESIRFTLASLLSLRLAEVILRPVRDQILEGYASAGAVLAIAVCLIVLFNWLVRLVIDAGKPSDILSGLSANLKSILYPILFIPLMIPAALEMVALHNDAWPWTTFIGVLAILAVQTGISVLLDRARFSYSRCLFLEDEMSRQARILSEIETPIAALRALTAFWFKAAAPLAIRVTWGNTSIQNPTGMELPSTEPLRLLGDAGLRMEVWPTTRTPLDAQRLDIFINQTETVLTNLELRKRVGREGWQCLEAMVYSLDMTDRRQTGYSRRVADMARRLGKRLGIQSSGLEDIEMAAMLHLAASMLEKAEEDWQETFSAVPARAHFKLPPVIVSGIRHTTENYDGTGTPDGLRGDVIPLVSRILRVASAYVIGLEDQSLDSTLLDIQRRTHSIYDPCIVEMLEVILREETNADEETGLQGNLHLKSGLDDRQH